MDSRTQHFQCETDLFSLYKNAVNLVTYRFSPRNFSADKSYCREQKKKNRKSKLICYPREQMMKHEYT